MTNNNKDKTLGIVATAVFHAVAIILLFTLCFRTPLPLPGESGVEVDMGMFAQGMGFESVQNPEPPTPPVKTPPIVEEQQEVEEEILSEDEEIPSLEEEKPEDEIVEEKPEEVKEEIAEEQVEENISEEVVEEKPVVNQRAMFQAPKNDQNTSAEGNTEGDGDQGSPDGLKEINRYEGNGGSGGGPSYDLGGRGAKSINTPSKDFKETGKIVVDIWVDKKGIVQRAEKGKGTDIYNEAMVESAIRSAKNSVFLPDENAAELQRGTITYTYTLGQ